MPVSVAECSRPQCTEPADTRGLCNVHYRRRLRVGVYGYRDAGKARAHILALRDLAWTYDQIEKAAGIAARQAWAIEHGEYRRVLCDTEQRILTVPLAPAQSHRGVDGTGITRRLQALQWMGWPAKEIAKRVGSTESTILTLKGRRRFSARLAQKIVEVFDELSVIPGPSRVAASRARAQGYAPPAAWDDESIDDPSAKPRGVR